MQVLLVTSNRLVKFLCIVVQNTHVIVCESFASRFVSPVRVYVHVCIFVCVCSSEYSLCVVRLFFESVLLLALHEFVCACVSASFARAYAFACTCTCITCICICTCTCMCMVCMLRMSKMCICSSMGNGHFV
jgi:hypothetical protein